MTEKKVSREKWHRAAKELQNRRKTGSTSSKKGEHLYQKILKMVHVGNPVLDVGCGSCYLEKILPKGTVYLGLDPFPIKDGVYEGFAEDLIFMDNKKYDTVFMMAALDNVQNLTKALEGLKHVAKENIVILTGIGIEPDKYHTVRVDREDLIEVLGEPDQEIELLPKVFLFEFKM